MFYPRFILLLFFISMSSLGSSSAQADPVGDFFKSIFSSHDTHSRAHRARAADAGQTVLASYYGGGWKEQLASHTASGERFRADGFTAAHRSLPFGTRLKVCYKQRCAVVRVNDRGPAAWTGRSLDLAFGAARAIGMTAAGVARVQVVILD